MRLTRVPLPTASVQRNLMQGVRIADRVSRRRRRQQGPVSFILVIAVILLIMMFAGDDDSSDQSGATNLPTTSTAAPVHSAPPQPTVDP
jgi:hypothetical protein